MPQLRRRIESFTKPIIAAVNGLAFGGGCELVESTHIALAADTATFNKAEMILGTMRWSSERVQPGGLARNAEALNKLV